MSTTTLQVRKDDLKTTRLVTTEDAPLAPGQVRVRVDSFALTANNITYAAFGEQMDYWQFYPAGEDGWGVVPVWGFGSVVQSLHPGVAVGERLYGYWPMAGSAVLQPEKLTEAGFFDASAHRRKLFATYNRYFRVNRDPLYTAGSEDAQSVLRPLFITSWLIDDFLADNNFFGAGRVILSSASSKTAYGTAHCLSQREGIEVVGLTSAGNKAFCESLGCYTRVLTYEALEKIPAAEPCVYVDFAGNADLRRAIHERFTALAYSCAVGGTHVEHLGGGKGLPGPKPTLFFAPAQIQKRIADWGPAEFGRRMVEAWRGFLGRVNNAAQPWLVVEHRRGPQAVQQAYGQMLSGRADPRHGLVLSLR